jgi:hypothetical protein
MALPLWMATTLVVGGSFLAQYLARQVEPLCAREKSKSIFFEAGVNERIK